MYKKAREGVIPDFTGIDSPYEIPDQPHHVAHTETANLEMIAKEISEILLKKYKS